MPRSDQKAFEDYIYMVLENIKPIMPKDDLSQVRNDMKDLANIPLTELVFRAYGGRKLSSRQMDQVANGAYINDVVESEDTVVVVFRKGETDHGWDTDE